LLSSKRSDAGGEWFTYNQLCHKNLTP
jgi:hypothetical protein